MQAQCLEKVKEPVQEFWLQRTYGFIEVELVICVIIYANGNGGCIYWMLWIDAVKNQKIKCNFVSGTAGSAAWELELYY